MIEQKTVSEKNSHDCLCWGGEGEATMTATTKADMTRCRGTEQSLVIKPIHSLYGNQTVPTLCHLVASNLDLHDLIQFSLK